MGLESGDEVSDLNPNWPLGGDPKSEGDDHLRLIKSVIQNDVLSLRSGGTIRSSVTYTPQELTFENDGFQRIAFRKTDGTLVADLRSEASDDFTIQCGEGGLEPYRFSQVPLSEGISIVRRSDGDGRYAKLFSQTSQTISTDTASQNVLQLENTAANPTANLLNVKVNGQIVAKIDPDPGVASADESLLTREAADTRYPQQGTNDARYVRNASANTQSITNSADGSILNLNSTSGATPANLMRVQRGGVDRFAVDASGTAKVGGNSANGVSFLTSDGSKRAGVLLPDPAASAGLRIQGSDGNWIALLEPQGTAATNPRTVMTREKGDARYVNGAAFTALIDVLALTDEQKDQMRIALEADT